MKPKEIANLMLEKKALDIKIFDVKKITTMTDHFIICSTDSEPQTKAITVHIEKTMKKMVLSLSASHSIDLTNSSLYPIIIS